MYTYMNDCQLKTQYASSVATRHSLLCDAKDWNKGLGSQPPPGSILSGVTYTTLNSPLVMAAGIDVSFQVEHTVQVCSSNTLHTYLRMCLG